MGYFAKGRVEAVCDGIFAIILTLLVLEIKVPHIHDAHSVDELVHSLRDVIPKFIAWVISFFTVMVIWVNHHRIFESLKKIDHTIFWLNANLLLWISFYPFTTALLGDYPDNNFAASFYGMASFLMGIGFLSLRYHMWRHPELTDGYTNDELWSGVRNVFLFGPVLYLLGAASAWIHPYIAFAFYAFITIYFIFPHRDRSAANRGEV
ncbi:MAG TPA: TMEM175 family protein [Pyrinomonadaceae bacterium]|jgi:uncharacterized membrane protein|nr:TMEM175 family protein [Pyrinomonadaceae bacterium]